ncbi:MAG: glutathione S-transferase family protein [Pseudomonadota bacterium]
MKLFHSPRTRSSRVAWLLEEAGVDYERVHIELGAAEQPAEFAAASPMHKVPAIQDGEVSMSDSAAIAIYIADRYPSAGLAPAIDHPLRGRYLYWCLYTPGVIEPAMAEQAAGNDPNPRRNGWGSFDLMVETLEAAVKDGPWLLGERFSAADIVTGSSVAFMRMFDMLPASDALAAYADRCVARPAYQKAMAMDAG